MTKKKSIWTLFLAICFVVPVMFLFTACGNKNDSVKSLEGSNSIVAEGEFKKGSKLISEKVEKTDSSYSSVLEKISDKDYKEEKIAVFDISISDKNGSKIQPDNSVKITMPKPFESGIGYTTFHIKDDGTVESLETSVVDGNIVFKTSSFSYFVVSEKILSFTFSGGVSDSLEHSYNGAAVFVSKKNILVDGVALSEITNEEILNRISYEWRERNTNEIVTPDVDITITGESYTYGVNRDMTVGDEYAGPCVVGEYKFVLLFDGKPKFTQDATITENSFEKISSIYDFNATTAPTIFGKICYYTIVGVANGQMYVMQMPADATSISDAIVETAARPITADENGRLTLGGKFDFVFTPMRYFYDEEKYYPEDSRNPEDLLMDFCTGFYGAREGKINLATPVINRIGWTRLSGDRIVREKGEYVGINYGNLVKFDSTEDGAVTIYAPRKGETENNSLRLVKNADGSFVFTGVDKTTDTRESFPIYIYKNYVKYENYGMQKHVDLNKNFDNEQISFNIRKDLIFENSSVGDAGACLKTNSIRFEFTDLDGNHISYGEIRDEEVFGPKEVGKYRLILQLKENDKWVEKALLCQFEIKAV